MSIVELIGTSLLALCAVPQAIDAVKTGHARGISVWMLLMWFFGELFVLAYVMCTYVTDRLLIANYVINLIAVSVLLKYYFWPREL